MNSPQKIISSEASLHPDLPFFYGEKESGFIKITTRSILFSREFSAELLLVLFSVDQF